PPGECRVERALDLHMAQPRGERGLAKGLPSIGLIERACVDGAAQYSKASLSPALPIVGACASRTLRQRPSSVASGVPDGRESASCGGPYSSRSGRWPTTSLSR